MPLHKPTSLFSAVKHAVAVVNFLFKGPHGLFLGSAKGGQVETIAGPGHVKAFVRGSTCK